MVRWIDHNERLSHIMNSGRSFRYAIDYSTNHEHVIVIGNVRVYETYNTFANEVFTLELKLSRIKSCILNDEIIPRPVKSLPDR